MTESLAPVSAPASMPYLHGLTAALARAETANRGSLGAAAAIVAGTVASGGIVFVFGSGHSQLAGLELSRRAGGLVPLQVLFDPLWGASEDVEGYAAALLRDTPIEPGDCLIAISNSGTTAAPIEMATAARAAGARVIAVTAVDASRRARPRHSSGRRLFELADAVLDTATPNGDAAVRLPDVAAPVGPTSTLVAAAILHEIVIAAVASLAGRGIDPPLYRPNAEAGGREHNEAMFRRYRTRLRGIP